MDAATRIAVRERARDRCEYCGRRAAESPLIPLHVEHVVPLKHGGDDSLENLAFACAECNLAKGPNLTGIDPASGELTSLFHPRKDRWDDHFVFAGIRIEGTTAVGRTTVRVMNMNYPARLRVRSKQRNAL